MNTEIILKYIGSKDYSLKPFWHRIIFGQKKYFRLEKDIHFTYKNNYYVIPEGFETDLSSVPRILWWLLPPYGDFLLSAIVHDYIYVTKKLILSNNIQYLTRSFADITMLNLSLNIDYTKYSKFEKRMYKLACYLRYFGVRLFGWLVW